VAQRGPFPIDVTGREEIFLVCLWAQSESAVLRWLAQGHALRSLMPYTADAERTLYFCGCKQTGSAPLCDGSHNRLS
jgi:CDGSH iron-sulfur domain-containing protein 3